MKKIYFVTGNAKKIAVAKQFFIDAGLGDKFEIVQLKLDTPEIQDELVENVALSSARWAAEQMNIPVICADAGLYIDACKGFPGPYVKYANDSLSVEQFLKLIPKGASRRALWHDALAYHDPQTGESVAFLSITEGVIKEQASDNTSASSVDRIFAPNSKGKLLADMTNEEQATCWNVDRWYRLTEYLTK